MQQSIQVQPYPQKSGYSGGQKSPAAIAATIGIHVAVAGAIVLMPAQTFKIIEKTGILTYPVPIDPAPPPPPPEQTPKTDPKVDQPDPIVKTGDLPDTKDIIFADRGGSDILRFPPTDSVDPPHVPIFVGAKPNPRYAEDFQPQYPGAMIRAETEGFVKLRIFISAEGRVISAELIEATDPSFWDATRKQALRYWRFTPATRDGKAVASEQVMTVRFRLADL